MPLNPLAGLRQAQSVGPAPEDINAPGAVMRGEMPLAPGMVRGLMNLPGQASSALSTLRNMYRGFTGSAVAPAAARIGGNVAETLGEINPEYTPRGGEEMFNTGQGAAPRGVDPTEQAYTRIMGAKGAPRALQGLSEAAPRSGMSPTMQDFTNPSSQAQMERLYQQANPTFRRLQQAGQFSGDRTIGSWER